jgi:hypothetical protein
MLDHLFALDLREVRFDNLKDVRVSFSMLNSAPNLEELIISVSFVIFSFRFLVCWPRLSVSILFDLMNLSLIFC